ncbi:hypothetical protein [Salinicola peritrichatus]|uniref:hypothetical protein n=1 Tax=Salinicola peritrichatus TaxID=1267424 RepID=UPI0013A63046|nr:hypothetical protein [Salinicola peritrichatus]
MSHDRGGGRRGRASGVLRYRDHMRLSVRPWAYRERSVLIREDHVLPRFGQELLETITQHQPSRSLTSEPRLSDFS